MVSAKAFIPVAAAGSIVFAIVIKGNALIINADSCTPISASEGQNGNKDVIPAIRSATDNAIIAAARIPAPANTCSSTILIPVINGVALTINSDKQAPR